MEARNILRKVREQLKALNEEFKTKKVHWRISDLETFDGKIIFTVTIDKKGDVSKKTFKIWRRNDDFFYLRNEDEPESQIVSKEHLFSEVAIITYGGQVLGTSLMPDNWGEQQFRHLNVIPAT